MFSFSSNSLFSIPRNKRFVCVNTNRKVRADPLTESINRLTAYIERRTRVTDGGSDTDSEDEIRPFKGFAKPLSRYKSGDAAMRSDEIRPNRLLSLIGEHVEEAIKTGFDDSIAKFKGKSHFLVSLEENTPECRFLFIK